MQATVDLKVAAFAFLLFVGIGCTEEPERRSHPSRQALSDSIEAGYERLQRAYADADTLPPDVRQMRGALRRMHGQMRRHRRRMGRSMHGGGEMHGGRGMRGGRRRDGGEKTRRGGAGRDSTEMREWHQQMMSMHARMARMHDESGLAARHRRMERRHRRMMKALSSNEAVEPSASQQRVSSGEAALAAQGKDLYSRHCASCHGQSGNGLGPFPPLAGTKWITGDAETGIRIVLHGLQGRISVNGRTYNNVMPAFGRRLSDGEVAAILSYVRSAWGTAEEAVEPEDVREVRAQHSERVQPWTASQLRTEK